MPLSFNQLVAGFVQEYVEIIPAGEAKLTRRLE
jgi:hypothetical protein